MRAAATSIRLPPNIANDGNRHGYGGEQVRKSGEADYIFSTGIEYSSVYTLGAASHIYISAFLDIVLYLVASARVAPESKGETDNVEEFLSETKV